MSPAWLPRCSTWAPELPMELSRGSVQEVIVRGENGYAVVLGAGRGTLLLAVTNKASKLGLIFFDMREAIWSLQKVL